MALAGHDELAMVELRALRQGLVQAVGGVDAFEPIVEQGLQTTVAQTQQLGQSWKGVMHLLLICLRLICLRLMRVSDGRRRNGIERQARRWRIAGKGAHGLDAADLQRAHALTQRSLERVLPTGLHVDVRPQAVQAVQPMLDQPGFELALGLHLLLQGKQRRQARADIGLLARFGIHASLLFAALFFQHRRVLLQLMQASVGQLLRLLRGGGLAAQLLQALHIGSGQRTRLDRQPFAARLQRARLLFDVAAVRCQHVDLLLHLADLDALCIGLSLRGAHGVLDVRLLHRLVFGLRGQQLGLLLGDRDLLGDAVQLQLGLAAPLVPLFVLQPQVHQPLLDALSAFHHVADALFEAAHLQRRFGQHALRRVQPVASRVMRLADRLQLGLDMAQLGDARFHRRGGLQHGLLDTLFLGRRIAMLQEPQLVQLLRAAVLQRAVMAGHLGLLFQALQVVVQLAQDVVHAQQVLARVLEPVLGLAASFLVLADASRLFEEQAQLFRARFDDAADGALADDGVGAWPQAGAEEYVLHIAPAHHLVVDEIAAGAIARQDALDGNLGVLVPLPTGPPILVAEDQLDAGAAGRFALARAVEDDVLHALAAQLAGLAFTEHPAHRVHDVGLAAAIGPDHADALPGQLEGGGVGKGLEARKLDLVQAHSVLGSPWGVLWQCAARSVSPPVFGCKSLAASL